MRLIDADELAKNFAVPSNELFYAGTVLEYIKDAPTVEAIPKGAYEQVEWERDMAIQQLNDYGVQLGEKADCAKVVRCKECLRERHCKFTQYQGMNGYCSLGERICDECVECDYYWANSDSEFECQGQAKPCHEFIPKRGL